MWDFFSHVVDLFVQSDHKVRIIIMLLLILFAVVGSVIGVAYFLHKTDVDSSEISRQIDDKLHPPTDKAENLKEISQRLVDISSAIQELRSDVDSVISSDNVTLSCGINDDELDSWEVSVAGNNVLRLKDGDDVLLINVASPHIPSGKFHVKFVRTDNSNRTKEIYVNSESAKFLGINNPMQKGVFDLKAQRIR